MLPLLALGLSLSFGAVHAADAEAACGEKAAEKKLAGTAKTSFVKKCVADAGGAMAAPGASATCEKSAADKKLAGAAKTAHIKKCNADEKGGTQAPASAPKK